MVEDNMSRIRGPYVRFCERDEAVTPHPTRYAQGWAVYRKEPGKAVRFRRGSQCSDNPKKIS